MMVVLFALGRFKVGCPVVRATVIQSIHDVTIGLKALFHIYERYSSMDSDEKKERIQIGKGESIGMSQSFFFPAV